MKLHIDDKRIGILPENKLEKTEIKSAFTYQDMKNAFAGGKFDIKKIKKVFLGENKKGFIFLASGFLHELLELAKSSSFGISEIRDKRTRFSFQKKDYSREALSEYFPFSYNQHQVDALRKMLKTSYGIIKSATGSGKAEILIAFIKETQLPTLVLVNKVGLCDQLAERAVEAGLEAGIWHGKSKTTGKVQFATIQSVKSLPSLTSFSCLILDEVHHASSKSFQEFLSSSSYPIRFGFSATPNKGDAYTFALIRQYMGKIIYEVETETMIENNVIALPKIVFIPVDCPPTLDWQSAYEQGIINNHERNMKIADLVERHDEPTLILIKDVKHKQGELIKNTIEENTHKKVEYIHGSSKGDRNQVIKDFEAGEIDVIVATNILNEGISIKSIRVLINASGGKSKVENLQKLGRGTRIMHDKAEVKIYDFYDRGNKFTERHSEQREYIYKKEGFIEIIHE